MEKTQPVKTHKTTYRSQLQKEFRGNLQTLFFNETDKNIQEKCGKKHTVENQNLRVGVDKLAENGGESPEEDDEMKPE